MISEIIKRLQYIDALIQEHKTGTAADLGEVIGVSERTVYKYLKMMKRLGAPIAFNAFSKTYYYKKEGSFVCMFTYKLSNGKYQDFGEDKLKLSIVGMEKFLLQLSKNIFLNMN